MIGLLVLAVVVLAGVVGTFAALADDRPRTAPRSRHVDPAFLPPSRWP